MSADFQTFVIDKHHKGIPVQHIAALAGKPIDSVRRIVSVQIELEKAMEAAKEPPPAPVLVPSKYRMPDDYVAPLTKMQILTKEVAVKYGLTVGDLLGRDKAQRFAVARHELMYRLVYEAKLPIPRVGKYIGNRDRATIIHGAMRHGSTLTNGAVLAMAAE